MRYFHTEAELRQMCRDYQSGMPVTHIRDKYGFASSDSVYVRLRHFKIPLNRANRAHESLMQIASSGASYEQLCEVLKVSGKQLHRILPISALVLRLNYIERGNLLAFRPDVTVRFAEIHVQSRSRNWASQHKLKTQIQCDGRSLYDHYVKARHADIRAELSGPQPPCNDYLKMRYACSHKLLTQIREEIANDRANDDAISTKSIQTYVDKVRKNVEHIRAMPIPLANANA